MIWEVRLHVAISAIDIWLMMECPSIDLVLDLLYSKFEINILHNMYHHHYQSLRDWNRPTNNCSCNTGFECLGTWDQATLPGDLTLSDLGLKVSQNIRKGCEEQNWRGVQTPPSSRWLTDGFWSGPTFQLNSNEFLQSQEAESAVTYTYWWRC